jgi:hypothetical protein
LLESMLEPQSRHASARPFDEEPTSEEEEREMARRREWLKHNPGVPNEEVLAEYGLSPEDFRAFGRDSG